jgi:succinate dehydrogenase / fumarate reductase, cytochrome b subunit
MAESTSIGRPRPLSPHLQIWRWHVTMAASILLRVTGVGCFIGMFLVGGWAWALASGPDAYGAYMGLLGSLPGKVILFGFTVAVFFHLFGGIRHLAFDAGRGFEKGLAGKTAWAAVALSLIASVAVWVVAAMNGALGS